MTLDTGNLHVRRGPILMKPGPPAREEGILSRHSTHRPRPCPAQVFWQLVTEARRYRALREDNSLPLGLGGRGGEWLSVETKLTGPSAKHPGQACADSSLKQGC